VTVIMCDPAESMFGDCSALELEIDSRYMLTTILADPNRSPPVKDTLQLPK